MASPRKSERLISSRGHGCCTISPPQLPATATRFPSHGSGRPGLVLRTATKLSSVGFEPTAVLTLIETSSLETSAFGNLVKYFMDISSLLTLEITSLVHSSAEIKYSVKRSVTILTHFFSWAYGANSNSQDFRYLEDFCPTS